MTELILQSEARIEAAAGKPAKVSILAYAGGLMTVPGWGPVCVDLAGLELPASAVPLLIDHDSSIDGIAGSGKPVISQYMLLVEGQLAPSESAQKLITLSKSGVAFGASVGIEPIKRDFIKAGTAIQVNGRAIKSDRDFILVRSGKLREVSITAVAADSTTSVSIVANWRQNQAPQHKEANMPPENQNDSTPLTAEQIRASAQIEADRLAAVATALSSFPVLHAQAIRENWGATRAQQEAARERELTSLRASRGNGGGVFGPSQPRPTNKNILAAAVLLHAGCEDLAVKGFGEQAAQQARDLRARCLMDIAAAAFRMNQIDAPADREEFIRASFSTTGLPGILSNAAGKVMEQAYQAVPSVAKQVARKLTADDFKQAVGYRLTGDLKMLPVAPDGELQHGGLDESSFSYQLGTYGRMFSINRQMYINDDLGAFMEVPRLIGRGAALALEQAFWTLVLANTGDFFSADNKNLLTGGDSVLGITALTAAVQKFLSQIDANGDPIVVTPKYLVVPPELNTLAESLYASQNVIVVANAGDAPTAQAFAGKYQPLCSPYLSNANMANKSDKGWYLFGSPADVAAFGIAYLQGSETPIIEETEMSGETLGRSWRGYIDFAVCQIDTHGAVKSAGQ